MYVSSCILFLVPCTFLSNFRMMIRSLIGIALVALLISCNAMKKMSDQVYIHQRSIMGQDVLRIDSLLIVTSGSSATQQISEDFIVLFQEYLQKKGVTSQRLFISYSGKRINEESFDNREYAYTLWIYEQDRKMQQLENYNYLIPLAIKLTDNNNSQNIWIATSIINSMVRKKYYREKYAGMLMLMLQANGLIQ